jgi:hypothetical protein
MTTKRQVQRQQQKQLQKQQQIPSGDDNQEGKCNGSDNSYDTTTADGGDNRDAAAAAVRL